MLEKLKESLKLLRTITTVNAKLDRVEKELGELKLLVGSVHASVKDTGNADINSYEFKVFSQFGDDGIIQYLISKVPIVNKTFIEFGVEDFFESNSRFLMMKDNWEGFVIDGGPENINRLKSSDFYWKYNLGAECSFITKENINSLLEKSGFDHDLGILSIDLDGIDYWIWKEINKYSPRILILEYNSVFGPDNHWSIPYSADFQRLKAHYSGIYSGVSLASMYELSETKGYDFVGSNLAGNNAYFVRKDINTLPIQSLSEGYKASKFRESRSADGIPTFAAGDERLKLIAGMPIYNTRTNSLETITING
jgi:hypothetical protein